MTHFTCTPHFHTGDEMAHANTKRTPWNSPKLGTDHKFRYIGNRKLGQGTFTAFIPADRPLLTNAEIRQGSKVYCPSDIQWAPSQNRQRLIFTGSVPDGRADLVCGYVGGWHETFEINDLNGAQNTECQPYTGPDSGTAADPAKPPVAQPPATSAIELPASYAGKVGLVAIVQGRKFTPCTRDPANPARWTHEGKKASKYGIRWNVKPVGSVATYNSGFLGLWSVTDGARFLSLAEILAGIGIGGPPETTTETKPDSGTGNPSKPPEKPETKPDITALHSRTSNSLTLRADFAAVVTKVDALANIVEPGNPNPIIIPAVRTGNTWTLPKALASYPTGNRPNTWRIRLNGTPPDGVTYHTSLMHSYLREGDTNTYPPTTRQ